MTNHIKVLKPDILKTASSPLQIKDWFKQWENYMLASGWGQGGNKRTQLTYLLTMVSDKVRTVNKFDNVRIVNQTLYQIKQYLKMAIMQLCLQRLEVLRYKPPQRQTQTVTTQTVVQMFCEVDIFRVT